MSPSFGQLEIFDLKDYVDEFTGENPFIVFVGTDSDSKDGKTVYATAIVVHRLGNGATYFYRKVVEKGRHDMYTRLFREAELSVEMAKAVREFLGISPVVHLDVGDEGESSKILPTLVGYVVGMGFECTVKPGSFAAYKIAHRHTKW